MARAAKVRVTVLEPQMSCSRLHSDLLHAFATARFKREAWDGWYQRSHILTLMAARAQSEHAGVTEQTVWNSLVKKHAGLSKLKLRDCFRRQFQATMVAQLAAKDAYDPERALRKKLSRWRIPQVPEGTLVRRALQICKQSAHLVPPRVSTAALRALFNGWCCARRFQIKKILLPIGMRKRVC